MGWERGGGADLSGLGSFIGNKLHNKRVKALKSRLEQEAESRPDGSIDYDALDRGVADSYGGSLAQAHNGDDVESQVAAARAEYLRRADREAGRMLVDDPSNIAGARQRQSTERLRMGDMEGGLQAMEMGDRAFTGRQAIQRGGATGPDAAVLAGGVATDDAKYGRLEAGQASTEQARQIRMKMAKGLTGQLLTKLGNPDMYDAGSIAASANAMFDYVPEFGSGLEAKVTDDGKVMLYRGETFVANLDNSKETLQFLNTFNTDPEKTLETVVASMQKDSEASKASLAARQKALQDGIVAGAKELLKNDLMGAEKAADVSQRLGTSRTNMEKSDIKLVGEPITDPVSGYVKQTIFTNGKTYEMLRASGEGGSDMLGGKTSVIFRTTGANPTVVDLASEPGGESAVEYMVALDEVHNAARRANNLGAFKQFSQILHNAFGAESAGEGAPASRGGATPSFPIKETDDYVRKIMSNAPELTGDSRSKAKQLMGALVQQESGGNHSAISPKGARGVTQVMPKTGVDPGFGVKPLQNSSREEYLRFGEDYLTAMLDRYDGEPTLALAAYNAGPGKVDDWMQSGKIRPAASAMGAVAEASSSTARGAIPPPANTAAPVVDPTPAAASGVAPTATAVMDPEGERDKTRALPTAAATSRDLGMKAVAKVPEMQSAAREYTRLRDQFADFQQEKNIAGENAGNVNLLSPEDRVEYSLLTAAVNSAKSQFEGLLRDTRMATATSTGYERGRKRAIDRKSAKEAGTAQFEKRIRQ